jgi:hypothetical protein
MNFFAPLFRARDYVVSQLQRIGDSLKSQADDLDARLAIEHEPPKEVDGIEEGNGRTRRLARTKK